jgi:hypothetical protein
MQSRPHLIGLGSAAHRHSASKTRVDALMARRSIRGTGPLAELARFSSACPHFRGHGGGYRLPSMLGPRSSGAFKEKDGFRTMHVRTWISLATKAVSTCALLALTFEAVPASAVEQCRFIQAKAEREACYQRQDAELAAKNKPEPRRDTTMEAVEQMKQEDQALDRQIRSICRGC